MTTMWIFSATKKELKKYFLGGESWDEFLIRMERTTRLTMKRTEVQPRPADTDSTSIWVSTETRITLNSLRRVDETEALFFKRLLKAVEISDVPKNQN